MIAAHSNFESISGSFNATYKLRTRNPSSQILEQYPVTAFSHFLKEMEEILFCGEEMCVRNTFSGNGLTWKGNNDQKTINK